MRRLLPTLLLLCLALGVTPAAPSALASPQPTRAPAGASYSVATWTTGSTTGSTLLTSPVAAAPKPSAAAHPRVRIAPMSTRGLTIFGQKVLRAAALEQGSPYAYGAAGPEVFDCSGFTRFVYARLGISLPHSSFAQYSLTEHLPASAARPGDLIFLSGLGHVGIYAGHGMMWDAPATGDHVRERAIYGSYVVGRVHRQR